MARGINLKNLLIVEGEDDMHVVEHIWRHHQHEPKTPLPFYTEQKRGVDTLLSHIRTHIMEPDRENLGILVDADGCTVSRWQAVVGELARAKELQGLSDKLPETPDESGVIINTKPRIGIWIMPNNHSPGELEDFIRELIPNEDPIWPRANHYINGIPSEERRFKPQKETKAKIHAWLAASSRPRLMGAAIGNGELNTEAPLAQTFYGMAVRLVWLTVVSSFFHGMGKF